MRSLVFEAGLEIIEKISRLPDIDALRGIRIEATIAGGMAVAYWTGDDSRTSDDLDVGFSHSLPVPDVTVRKMIDGRERLFYLDHAYTDVFSLLQEDYPDRRRKVAEFGCVDVYVFHPVDLVTMKTSRFLLRDRRDIENLIGRRLVDRHGLSMVFRDALAAYPGDRTFLRYNMRDVMRMFGRGGLSPSR